MVNFNQKITCRKAVHVIYWMNNDRYLTWWRSALKNYNKLDQNIGIHYSIIELLVNDINCKEIHIACIKYNGILITTYPNKIVSIGQLSNFIYKHNGKINDNTLNDISCFLEQNRHKY